MNQHGFARDMNFELINTTDNYTTYKLTSSEETKEVYPYDFNLFITDVYKRQPENKGWSLIKYKDTIGFVYNKYLSDKKNEQTIKKYVNVATLNFRSGPVSYTHLLPDS